MIILKCSINRTGMYKFSKASKWYSLLRTVQCDMSSIMYIYSVTGVQCIGRYDMPCMFIVYRLLSVAFIHPVCMANVCSVDN